MSRINETLKQKIDELDLDRRVNDLTVSAEQAVNRALDNAAGYAHEHRDDLDRMLSRVSTTIDDRTGGKYADRLSRFREQVEKGVDKLAERQPADDVQPGDQPGADPDDRPGDVSGDERRPADP